ncbi:hypothetical protein OPT61_g6416 [Boeremia exigua]|uniref:Uncharacterized protein n=1 Tax=Boeremia exigua TaxID=749465 RepID=A0ACC2I6R7_9PLEO|nr:hypothetical protein OPT61_g6416 [Boeremia exigua]
MDSTTRDPQAPLRLLSLDGGGVRGLSSLMVLRDLMQSIAREEKRLGRRSQGDHEPLRPCDYFDLIGGTSTGGIIAILLSRLRLNCEQCIDIYLKLAEQIFKHDRSFTAFGMKVPTGATRFSGVVLATAIRTALKDLGFDPDELMWDEALFEEIDTTAEQRHSSIWADVPVHPERPPSTDRHVEAASPTVRPPQGECSRVSRVRLNVAEERIGSA